MSELSEHGLKTVVGTMLSRFLRQIGQEKTECHDLDPGTGNPRMMTKAEALARTIWKLALGYEETTTTQVEGGPPKIVKRVHKPDSTFVAMIYDRLEGKVTPDKDNTIKKQPLSRKVDEQAKKRLNSVAER